MLLVFSLTIVGCGGSSNGNGDAADAGDKQIALHMAATVPPDHSYTAAAEWFAKEVEEKTNGRLKPIVDFAGVHGGDVEATQAVMRGDLEMTWTSDIGLAGIIPELGFANLPYLFADYDEVDRDYRNGWVGEIIEEKAAGKGIIVLAHGENDFRGLSNSKHAITKLSDFNGLKLRVPETPMYMDFYERLGVLPTPMSITEVATALQQKAIDGQDNGAVITASNGFGQFQSYATKLNHMYSAMQICISEKIWNQLSADEQEILRETAKKAADMQVEQNRKDVDRYYAQMEGEGVEVIDITPELKADLQEIAKEMFADPKYEKLYGKDIMDRIKQEKL